MKEAREGRRDKQIPGTTDPFYLRGYCRVCNRHYFFSHQLDTDSIQFHQHHAGVCQRCRHSCARIVARPKIAVPPPRPEKAIALVGGIELGRRKP